MKRKVSIVLFVASLFTASAIYGQQQQSNTNSNVYNNTMTIFKTDVDKLQDVNDYQEVAINKAYIIAGSRFDNAAPSGIRGIKGGFATYLNDLYLGILYDGYLWNGNNNKVGSNSNSTFTFNNNFSVLFGKESFGGIGITLGFNMLQFDEDKAGGTTRNTRSGMINLGATWGKNFDFKDGTLKPELGFLVGIDMNEVKESIGNTTTTGGHGPSLLGLNLSTEYLYPKEGQHQTTLSFGDFPLFVFAYDENDQDPKNHHEGRFYNILDGEIKLVYDITGNLSLGYLAGLSLAFNAPSNNKDIGVSEFGFLPRLSAALTYKASEKFLFNTGVRLGAMEPQFTSNYSPAGVANYNPFDNSMNDNFGIFYQSVKPKSGSESTSWYYLPFVGAWGIGLLWQPEQALSADFSVSSLFNSPGNNLNFNVLFSLSL